MNNNAEIEIKDFRAIHSADIVLNGITVIAGVNGCGKSTISKLLRSAFDNTNDIDRIYFDRYYKSLGRITEIYKQIQSIFPEIEPTRTFTSCLLSNDRREKGRELLAKALKVFRNASVHSTDVTNRILNIITYNLHTEGKSLDETIHAVTEALDRAEEALTTDLRERPIEHLDEAIAAEFKEGSLLDRITIKEYGVPFYGKGVAKVPILHYIKDTTYIDSPLTLNFAGNSYPYDDEKGHSLFTRLRAKDTDAFDRDSYTHISHIIKGEPYLSEDIDEFRYRREDGSVFDLQDCATGIKAFAILQLLLRNGYVNDRSLIIIDEPEAHLHPQWIVEYAKIIVELNKQVGAKFFIATHSTDMVSALRYISEKEETLERLAFYNAVSTKENPYAFDYEDLGTDIEPIFASFNKSFDLIKRYGADNGL